MTALPLALALALAGLGTPPRNARPQPSSGAAAAPDATLTDAQVADRVHAYLSSIDTPITAERWQALGPRAVTPLEAVARNADELPSRRARALGALSVLGGDQARKVVLDVATAPDDEASVRASAVRAAGRLVGPKTLVKQLRPVLERSKDPTLRATTAEVLARHAPTSGCAAVRAQAARETTSTRAQYHRALARCGTEEP